MNKISILLEPGAENSFAATVMGLPECQAQGKTREEAIANVQQMLASRLANAELMSFELPIVQRPLPMAGIFKDDPQWDDFQAAIADHRRELDQALEAEYRQLDQSLPNHHQTDSAA